MPVEGLAAGGVPLDRCILGRPALPHDRRHLVFAARINQHQRFAAEAVVVLLDNAADQQCSDAGIESIAAAREDFEGSRGRQRMARRHAAIASHDGWTVGGLRYCADALQYQQGDESRGHAVELADGVCRRAGIARSFGLGSPHDDVSQLEAGAGVSLARHRASRDRKLPLGLDDLTERIVPNGLVNVR
jgi:hypothetical protein